MDPLESLLAQYQPNADDLKKQQQSALMLNIAAGLLGSRKGQEMRGLGVGLLGGYNSAQQVQHDAQQRALQGLQTRSAGMQYLGQKDAFDTQQAVNAAMKQYQPQSPMQGAMAAAPSLAPTNANVAQVTANAASQPGTGEYERLLGIAKYLEGKGLSQAALPYYAQAEKYAPQYDKIDTLMQDGKPVSVQTYKNRPAQTIPGYQPKPDYKEVGDGASKFFFDPLTQQKSGSFPMQMTPNESFMAPLHERQTRATESNASATQAQVGLSRQRLELERAQQNAPVWDPTAGSFVTRPTDGKPPTAIPVTGLPDKPLTEVQGNATAFGMRAKAANDIIAGLEAKGAPLGSVTALSAKNGITNYAAPAWAQQAQQAKLNFMSANLRKESGAAISQSEYDAEDKKYFPQPGDGKDVLEQKRKARDLAIQALAIQAGPGKKNIGGAGWSAVEVK